MHAHKIKVTIPANHELTFRLPDDFPPGPAEVIIIAKTAAKHRVVRLSGVIAPVIAPSTNIDPIANIWNTMFCSVQFLHQTVNGRVIYSRNSPYIKRFLKMEQSWHESARYY